MSPPRILVAGIGNIFFGDDAFGCEVVNRLQQRPWPHGVRVRDFGIRGLDLAYALLDGWDRAILVDAAPRGNSPGTLTVLDLDEEVRTSPATAVDPHGMDPKKVLGLLKSLGGTAPPIVLVACEPAELGTDEEPAMGLSAPVAAAVDEAVQLITAMVEKRIII